MFKVKIRSILKNLTKAKRKEFLIFLLATILFAASNNIGAYGYSLDRLRSLIGSENMETIRQYIIKCYEEYHAPLPKELITKILSDPDKMIESLINND